MTNWLRNPWLLLAARAINAAFFVTTSVYALLTSSPFAYEQFILPKMMAWLSNFVLIHADLYWLTFCVTVLTLAPYLSAGPARAAARAYVVAGSALGALLLVVPALPPGYQPVLGAAVALGSLAPLVWLALIDRQTAPPRAPAVPAPWPAARMLAVCAITALAVWLIYAAGAPIRLRAAGGLAAVAAGARPLLVGVGAAGVTHLTIFTIVFLVWALPGRASFAAGIAALGLVLQRVVFLPIAITGPASWAIAFAMAIAAIWSIAGVARHFGPDRSAVLPAAVLAAIPVAAYVALSVLTTFDWGFMLQKLSALAVGVVTFAAVRALLAPPLRQTNRPRRTAWVVPLIVLGLWAASRVVIARIPGSDFVLDAYSAGDPSYRLARQFLDAGDGGPSDGEFYALLRAHTSISERLSPISIDFVPRLTPPAARPPHIFLFVIDSLRRDYLSPYNPAVGFTPRLAEFARESVVFERAFSRYGGTGLSVPAIWAGAMVPHKQYVTPFAPMNALAKLLDAAGYRRFITRSHISEELFGFPEGTTMLDRHVPEMMRTFCGTMTELKQDLLANRNDARPIFAYTRPLDLHIGNTRFATTPPGESYPGFFEPYAARVRRIDDCFGGFVDAVKRSGLYEDSIIIVMSDHGDSLGEGLRWGHGYTVVPEVVRIPLLVHLPSSIRERVAADPSRVSFSTDVTPSLYALLGYRPERPRAAAGAPLFAAAASDLPDRRRDAFLIASSYGAVYGLVRHNGRRLYIADAVDGRDYLFDLSRPAGGGQIGMTDGERSANRALIREQVADLAAWYGVKRP